jgi:hypothetical protein
MSSCSIATRADPGKGSCGDGSVERRGPFGWRESWGRSVRACVEAAGARAYVFFFTPRGVLAG